MELKKYKALYENNWYEVIKVDYDYEIIHIKTGNGSARIHACYIDKMEVINDKSC